MDGVVPGGSTGARGELDRSGHGRLAGVGLGTLTWYGGFSTAVALVRKRLGARLLALVDLASGCALIGFGSLLGYRTLPEHA